MSLFMNKKVVLFDLDGTLIDSVGVWNKTDEILCTKLGAAVPDDLYSFREASLSKHSSENDPYLSYCADLKERYASPLSPAEILEKRTEISRELLKTEIRYKPGAPDFLRALRRAGKQLAIVSTTRKTNLDVYRFENRELIRQAPFDVYFSLMLTSEDAMHTKPEPDLYLAAVQKFGVSAADCIAIEDSVAGVMSAKAAGIDVIVIYDKYSHGHVDTLKKEATAYFDGYAELTEEFYKETESPNT